MFRVFLYAGWVQNKAHETSTHKGMINGVIKLLLLPAMFRDKADDGPDHVEAGPAAQGRDRPRTRRRTPGR